ncbi:MAG: DNA mismatch repair endonuclease MutL [Armatimonadota bacterium]
MPPRIILLDESVVNKIAAGEVVERPASVVKELVENSLDAGATSIAVEAVEGGRELIRVADDGCGMCREDAIMALQRHATSKIHSAEDLGSIGTLGFRGEALPSIASVSHLTLTTREHDSEEGVKVVAEGGEVTEVKAVGCPPGTSVEVARLFFNTPARRKFLRTSATERGHIADVVSWMALGHPEVALRLTHNGKIVFSTPQGADLRSVMATVYGKNAARELLPVELASAGISIHGFVSTPQLSRVNRSYQSIFVNRRFVRSRTLSHGLNQPFQSLLPSGRFPIAAIHIQIASELVDPNVHPTKIEVRFTRDWEVHNLVQQAVEQALSGTAPVRDLSLPPGESRTAARPHQRSLGRDDLRADLQTSRQYEGGRERAWLPRTEAEAAAFGEELSRRTAGEPGAEGEREPLEPQAAQIPEGATDNVRIIGQADNTYIVAQSGGSILLIDQHVAAERVIYERLLSAARASTPASQGLVVPVTLELSHREAAALEDNLETLQALGFEIEDFGNRSYVIRGIPLLLEGQNYEAVLRDLLEELAGTKLPQSLEERRKEVITAVACHSAVKAGEAMGEREMRALVGDLLKTSSPALCPHGRPIIVTLSLSDLGKRFGRP